MRTIQALAAVAVIVVSLGMPASAHRVDEYLQATLISLDSNKDKDQVEAFLRLTPGIAVSSQVLASIDTDGDGVISEIEKRAYAERVLADLSLTVDGHRLTPRLVSMDFPEVEQMKEGLRRDSNRIHHGFARRWSQPDTPFRKPSPKPDCSLPGELSDSPRAKYPRDRPESKRRPVVLSTGLCAGRLTSRTALPQMVVSCPRMERMASRSGGSPVRSGRIPFSSVGKWRDQKPPAVILKSGCPNVNVTCLRILREQTDLEPV